MLYPLSTVMLFIACIWNRNSLPALRAGSPLHASSVPRTANFVPTALRILTNARVTRFARSSKDPAQPTQNRISGASHFAVNSASVGTFMVDLFMRRTGEGDGQDVCTCRDSIHPDAGLQKTDVDVLSTSSPLRIASTGQAVFPSRR